MQLEPHLVAVQLQEWTENVWRRANPRLPPPRLFTVGRLDVASTGLLFVTNDGAPHALVALYAQTFVKHCWADLMTYML